MMLKKALWSGMHSVGRQHISFVVCQSAEHYLSHFRADFSTTFTKYELVLNTHKTIDLESKEVRLCY